MEIWKSTRHSKIAGEFGEFLFLYWLSKSGFEIALIDHTGIDLLAYNKKNKKRYGISVKTRTRKKGKENEGVYIRYNDMKKIEDACIYFGCIPYFGIVVDRKKTIDAILISYKDLKKINGISKTYINVKLGAKFLEEYKNVKEALFIKFNYSEFDNFSF